MGDEPSGKFQLFHEDQPGENSAVSSLMFGVGSLIMTATLVGALGGAGFGIVAMGLGLKYLKDDEIEQVAKLERMARGGIVIGGFAVLASVTILLIQAA
ncbi:MAG: hypothetical protein V3V01_03615 [Acidimicrobiales bacterium]